MFSKIRKKYSSMSVMAKSAFWYTFCNFLNKGVALLATPIFTRIMTEEQYGMFAIFQSWFSILIIFTSLNVFLTSFTKGLIKFKQDRGNFTSSQLVLTTLITFIFIAVYGVGVGFWTGVFNLSPVLMIAMFVELLVMPAYELWMARKRFEYDYKRVVIFSVLMNAVCLVVGVISVMLSESKVEARVFSDVGVKTLFALPIFILILWKGKKFINLKYWKYALAFNLPLIPHYLSNFVLNQSDRIMIGKMVGDAEAGIYSVSYTIATIIVLLVTAINSAIVPHIYKVIDSGIKKDIEGIKKIINIIVAVVSILCVVLMLFAPEVIRVFAGEKYMEAIYIIPPVAASVYFILVYSVFSNIEYFYQRTKKIAIATTVSAIANIVLNYFAIKWFGYIAAGYTTLICYVLLSIFHYIFYRQVVKEKLSKIKQLYDVRLIFMVGFAMIVFAIVVALTYTSVVIRYLLIFAILIVVLLKRDMVVELVKMLVGRKDEN